MAMSQRLIEAEPNRLRTARCWGKLVSNGGVGAAPRRQGPHLSEKHIVFQGQRCHNHLRSGQNGNPGIPVEVNMKRVTLLILFAIAVATLSHAGSIVVSNDEWMWANGELAAGNDTQFALNVPAWLTGGS